jgi:UDP-N-acetylmuramate dehydrogenase
MLGEIRGRVLFREPLSFHTSLRIGGPADVFIVPHDLDDLRHALAFAERERLPLVVVGGGNNLLVRDRGIRGVVLKLEGCLARAEFQGEEVVVGAGVSLPALIRAAADRDLGGLECLAGIPATLGGALATNARTREGAIGDFVSVVYYLHPDGTLGELKPGVNGLGYRPDDLPAGAVLAGCRLALARRPRGEIRKDVRARLRRKSMSEPLALASAGHVWKNPPGAVASDLVGSVGLRGKQVRAAEISSKDPNFIVNRGQATARDVQALIDLTRLRVHARFGITLEHEIRIVGEERAR